MHTWLEEKFKQGFFSALDLSFARFIADIEDETYAQKMMFVAAILSRELAQGHVCIDISNLDYLNLGDKQSIGDVLTPTIVSEFKNDANIFIQSLVGAKSLSIIDDLDREGQATPIVYDLQRLYLYRYWNDESILSKRLIQMASTSIPIADNSLDILQRLFPQESSKQQINWQKSAAAVAISRQFAVISGGPGTGKTTTVAKLLALLLSQDKKLNISLAAPTGKAAARLSESIGQAVTRLNIDDEIKALMPTQAVTLHRLLGARPNSKKFRFNADNPLHLDLLILDEASMVDLPLMRRLIQALPQHARLILLGDRDQLASVEAGAVLGDICQNIEAGYTTKQAELLSYLTGFDFSDYGTASNKINDSLCLLRHSYRFNADSGIGQLAKAINRGDLDALHGVWQQGYQDIVFHPLSSDAYQDFIKVAVDVYAPYLEAIYNNKSAYEILDTFAKAQVLCAIREGELGVEGINEAIKKALIRRELLPHSEHPWYVGRPIMVTRNDPNLGIFNGDIGICLRSETGDGDVQLKVYFIMPDGEVKSFLPSRIPEHQSVFAMTVHKSQGSEFEHTIMLLPSHYTPVITRELIYTGVTRAKGRFSLYATPDVFLQGVKTRTRRVSGLSARLSLS